MDLNQFLFPLTPREIRHKNALNHLSDNYKTMPTVQKNNETYYLFTDSEFEQSKENFKITLHPRFTVTPAHLHKYIELTYVYNGKCTQNINNKIIHLKQGDIIIIDTDIPHSIDMTDEEDILVNIIINPTYFREQFLGSIQGGDSPLTKFLIQVISETQEHSQYLLFSDTSSRIHWSIAELLTETFAPSNYTQKIKDHLLKLLLIDLINSFSVQAYGTNLNQNQLCLDILQYIEKNYLNITLESTAKHFGYSVPYFSKLIKELTGNTFVKIVHDRKLSHSMDLLRNSNYSVRDIASISGFSNVNNFYKFFKEKYHMTPSEYRSKK